MSAHSFDDFQNVTHLVAHYEEMEKTNSRFFLDESSFEQLIDYYERRKRTDKASAVADHAITQYPFSAFFLVKKAQFLFDGKQFDQALELLDRAEVYDPREIQIYLLRSDIYAWMDDFKKAVATLEHALDIADEEDAAHLYLELADVYEDWGKYEHVFECLRKSLELQPDNEEALNRMWFCVQFVEKYKESAELHQKIIDKEPYSHWAWFNLAHAYAGLGELEKAVDAFEYVIAINEKFEYAYKDCGDVLFRMEQYRKAIQYYKNALEAARPSKEIYFSIGESYECLNEYGNARNYYRKAIGIDPQFHEAFFRIGLCYRQEEKWHNALTSFERACKLKDDDPDYIEMLGDACYELGDLEYAIELYSKAVDIRPNSRDAWLALARTLLESGMCRDAFTVLDDACEQFDDPADIIYVKSAYYYLIGNKKESLLNLERALLVDFELHPIVFEISPFMEKDGAVLKVIDQYRTK
ncbi:MAG TPA: tetratricopeptide repeat protein [Chitinophagales bacterium]|nr:tetratricopeptide repeat protein [Chitinophagales bacterium]